MSSDYMIDSIHKILNPYGPINEATTTVLCDIEVILNRFNLKKIEGLTKISKNLDHLQTEYDKCFSIIRDKVESLDTITREMNDLVDEALELDRNDKDPYGGTNDEIRDERYGDMYPSN